jgi:hypothetical protein
MRFTGVTMPAEGRIEVHGLRDLNRAFARADKVVRLEKNKHLKRAAEPIRADAEALAVGRITRIGPVWSRMRVGVTTNVVYVAPKARSTRDQRLKRRKLADRLAEDAMVPALNRNRETVVRELDNLLGEMERTWGR